MPAPDAPSFLSSLPAGRANPILASASRLDRTGVCRFERRICPATPAIPANRQKHARSRPFVPAAHGTPPCCDCLDLTCIRLLPYKVNDELLVDVTQIIPLPEAANYEIKIRAQAHETRKARSAREMIFRRFWAQLIERSRASNQLLANRTTSGAHWLSAGIGRAGFNLNFVLMEDRIRIECYIRPDREGGRAYSTI